MSDLDIKASGPPAGRRISPLPEPIGEPLFPEGEETGPADKALLLTLPEDFWEMGQDAEAAPGAAVHALPPLAIAEPVGVDQPETAEEATDLVPQLVLPADIWSGGEPEGASGTPEPAPSVEEWGPGRRPSTTPERLPESAPFGLEALLADAQTAVVGETATAAPVLEPLLLAPATDGRSRRDRRRRVGGRAAAGTAAAAVVVALMIGAGPDADAPQQVDAAVPQTTLPTSIPRISVPRAPIVATGALEAPAAAADAPAAAPAPATTAEDTAGAPAANPPRGVPTTARAARTAVAPFDATPVADGPTSTREPAPAPAADPPVPAPSTGPSRDDAAPREPSAANPRRNRSTTETTVTTVPTTTTAPTPTTTVPGRGCVDGETSRPVPCD